MYLRILETNVLKFEIYEVDPAHFLSAPGLAWQACLKETEVKPELLTDVDMSLMVQEGVRWGLCRAIHRHAKANNIYLEDYNEDEEESFLQYVDANNLYAFAMIQPLPVDGFEWEENISKFNEIFIYKKL